MIVRLVHSGLVAVSCAFLLSSATAGTLSYFGSYRLNYSDNIELIQEGGTSGFYHTLGAGVGYEEHGTRLDANIDGSVEYINYPNGALANQTSLYLDGDLRWAFVKDRFYWVFTDSLTNQPIDNRLPNTPANRQQTNVFTTGPKFQYEFDQANRVQADVRYMNSWAEERDDFNADRWFGGASWIYATANATEFSLNATLYDVNLEQNGIGDIEDYVRNSVFAGWERRNGPSSLRLELGYIDIDFDQSDDESGWHALVAWNRTISSSSMLVLDVRHGLTDAALSIAGATNPDNIGNYVVSGQVYEASALDFSYTYNLTNAVLTFVASYEKQDYVSFLEVDRDLIDASINWTRNFGGGWNSQLSATFDWTEYDDGRSDNTQYLFAGAVYRGTRNLTYRFGANLENRNSNDPLAEYKDWGALFEVRYSSR